MCVWGGGGGVIRPFLIRHITLSKVARRGGQELGDNELIRLPTWTHIVIFYICISFLQSSVFTYDGNFIYVQIISVSHF